MFKQKPNRMIFAAWFATLAMGCMALFFCIYDPFEPIGPEWIINGSFTDSAATNQWDGWNEWTVYSPDQGFNNSPGVVLNTASNRYGKLLLPFDSLQNAPAFRASLRAKARDVKQGKDGYYLPHAFFFFKNAKSEFTFHRSHQIFNIKRDRGWRRYTKVFPTPPEAVSALLYIQNAGQQGVLTVDELSVIPVRSKASVPVFKIIFGGLWIVSFGLCIWALRLWTWNLGRLILLTAIVILTGVMLPKNILDGTIRTTSQTVKTTVQTTQKIATNVAAPSPATAQPAPAKSTPQPSQTKKLDILKDPEGTSIGLTHQIGHATLFGLLAWFSATAWISASTSRQRAGVVFACLLLFAASTEILQYISIDRTAGIRDLITDATGLTTAFLLFFIWRRLHRHITKKP